MNPWLMAGSALLVLGLVAWVSYRFSRGQVHSNAGYFLAGRGLTGTFIAGTLLLTNLSAEQLVGLNGSAYAFNMSSMAWEVTAVIAIVIMALVFLPRFLRGGYTTLPEYLSQRFGNAVRRLTSGLFLFGYGLVTIPAVLYSGAIAVLQTTDLEALTSLSRTAALTLTIVAIALVGSAYAVLGGLRAIAVSDTLNGVGLLFIGLLVPLLGLRRLGDGQLGSGVERLLRDHPEKLNAIGAADDPTPFATLFTGMILANLFYWGTNQYVIQRTLGAQSLAAGQKGVLLTGFFKLTIPFMMLLPGVIAFHLYGDGLATMDLAYPTLARDLLPGWLSGIFLAVLLGAVFSSFNSLVNSAATLFSLDLYAPWRGLDANDAALIRIGRIASLVITALSLVIAPLLYFAPEGLWQLIRKFTGFYNIPIIAIVLAAMFLPRVRTRGVFVAVGFHLLAYGLLTFVWNTGVHFIHLYAILFGIEMGIMLLMSGPAAAQPQVPRATATAPVDMTPWLLARPVAVVLLLAMAGLYLLFSEFGLA